MLFDCNLTSFAKEVAKASAFAMAKNSLTMTSCIMLEANGPAPQLTIKSTDGKMGFVSRLAVGVTRFGSVAVFADKLNAVLKNLPEGDITIDVKEGVMTITPAENKHIKVRIKCLDASKFPEIADTRESGKSFVMKTEEFTEMADSVSFSVGDNSGRAFLTGVCLESKDGKFTMVATDGRRLAMNRVPSEIEEFEPVIVPVKFFQSIKGLESEKVTITISNGTIYASTEDSMMFSALIGGMFPNYERVIPTDADNEIKVKAADLERAVNLISIMTDAKTKRIFLEATKDGLGVYGEDANYGDSRQTIHCEYNGEDVKTSFNVLLLSPCLKKIPTVDVVLRFPKGQRAWVINPTGDESIIYVLAPMNV